MKNEGLTKPKLKQMTKAVKAVLEANGEVFKIDRDAVAIYEVYKHEIRKNKINSILYE